MRPFSLVFVMNYFFTLHFVSASPCFMGRGGCRVAVILNHESDRKLERPCVPIAIGKYADAGCHVADETPDTLAAALPLDRHCNARRNRQTAADYRGREEAMLGKVKADRVPCHDLCADPILGDA